MSQINNRAVGAIPKPEPRQPKAPKYLPSIGRVGKQRQADRRAKLKAEPADYRGKRQCYLCLGWFEHVDLEHVKDASTNPELRHDPDNHRWACRACNTNKKLGKL